ncbi:MAG: hypothetical protein QF664_10405 [Dehalococcoidia bacterium]|jgi:hypothetical protein|nr:hypothetical protein [Dehalococcoidia bacterium]
MARERGEAGNSEAEERLAQTRRDLVRWFDEHSEDGEHDEARFWRALHGLIDDASAVGRECEEHAAEGAKLDLADEEPGLTEEQLGDALYATLGWFGGDRIDREDWYWKEVDNLVRCGIAWDREQVAWTRDRAPRPQADESDR